MTGIRAGGGASSRSLHFNWVWRLSAEPEILWPLVSDTDRFNRDSGAPVLALPEADASGEGRLLAMRFLGMVFQWREEPFEWSRPNRFSVTRRFLNGPLVEMRISARLDALSGGGTRLLYRMHLSTRHLLWTPFLALVFRFAVRRRFGAVFRRYDGLAARGAAAPAPARERAFEAWGRARLASRRRDLLEAGAHPALVTRLSFFLSEGDDRDLARMRPYALADAWGEKRRDVLELCLLAVRAGLLDFRWDLLCPSCRGAKSSGANLGDVRGRAHCDTCRIDFTAGFDGAVEVTFRPNPSIRSAASAEYCVGGPQRTPRILARRSLQAGATAILNLNLEDGRYLLRSPALPGGLAVTVAMDGSPAPLAGPGAGGWPGEGARWHPRARLTLENPSPRQDTFLLERMEWADDAATAAEVTALQTFRDLFSQEALRPGEEIAVGSLAFLFTDLKGSTRMYREFGDAKAFALVMDHFDTLKSAISAEGGGIVKTIGDAVLAVFPRPQSALRAALEAQRRLSESELPLVLKAGVHCGPCIAVTQNDRLDYFGSTLNLAARLLGFCEGGDVVLTQAVAGDPEVVEWLAERARALRVDDFQAPIRGFDQESFALKRILPGTSVRDQAPGPLIP